MQNIKSNEKNKSTKDREIQTEEDGTKVKRKTRSETTTKKY